MEDLIFKCGSCHWYEEMKVPEGQTPPEGWSPRGHCYLNPPSVYPFPKQTQTLAAMGQPSIKTVPMTMRTIVEQKDRSCGSYTPVPEAMEFLKPVKKEGGCGDCVGSCGSECCEGGGK